jgi:cohesin complex subunit SA-1/2
LLEIASFFDLNQYTLCRQEKNLDRLLNLLQEIVNKHNDTSLLEECSKLLGYLCDEESSVCSKCDITRSAILDDLVAKFQAAMRALDQLTEIDENEMYPLQIALKRLSAFAQNHDITRYDDLIQYSFTILKWAHSNEGFEHELVKNALLLSRSVLTWNMTKLTQEVITFDVEEVLSEEQKKSLAEFKERVQSIAKMSKKYYKLCNQLLTNDDPLIGEAAYFELCDLLIMLSPKLKNVNKEYKPLVLECPTNDTNMLSVFVMNSSVFAQEALNEKPSNIDLLIYSYQLRIKISLFR